jgi:hypothetical protein
MKPRVRTQVLMAMIVFTFLFLIPSPGLAKEREQRWEILNPKGIVKIEPMEINPHPSTLEGKTIMLRWNGKHNGDNFLNRVAELLAEKVREVKIIKSWEVAPETVDPITGSQERSLELMKKLAALKPDLVIASQAD